MTAILSLFRRMIRAGQQRFTVMFIPHSEKKIFNVQISVFTLLFFLCLTLMLLIAFVGFSTHFTAANRRIVRLSMDLNQESSLLESYRESITVLKRESKEFEDRMYKILNAMDSDWAGVARSGVGGDLSSLIRLEQYDNRKAQGIRDLQDLGRIEDFLRNAKVPLETIRRYLVTEREFLHEIPTLWPLQGGMGYITQRFGPNRHPFHHEQWYLHRGLDIAWKPGTEILATADGVVQHVGTSSQFGQNVIIRHKYGFSTRYAHLQGIVVETGQRVRRGQVIGYLGNTGISTGPHLHYEVRIAGQVVDPELYLDLSLRWGSSTFDTNRVGNGR